MARIDVPYLTTRPRQDGTARYFWQPAGKLKAAGWKIVRLDDSQAVAIEQAREWNAKVEAWRATGALLAPGHTLARPRKDAPKPGSVAALVETFKAHQRYTKLQGSTQGSYDWCLKVILLPPPQGLGRDTSARAVTRQVAQGYYARLVEQRGLASANGIMRVARRLFGTAWNLGQISTNPFEKPGLSGTAPRLRIWTAAELTALVEAADKMGARSIGDAALLAYYLGQRQGDVLKLTRLQVDGWAARHRQGKTGVNVDVVFTPRLRTRIEAAIARLDAADSKAPELVVSETTGKRYGASHFRHLFADVRAAAAASCASIGDAWFMDLRDTTVTNLANAGCTIPQICSVTGHTEKSAYTILKHYLALNGDMASTAIGKLVEWETAQAAKQASA